MEGVRNFKFRSLDPDYAHFRGQSVVHWLVHVMVSVWTKYEVSIFGHSRDIKRVPKFRKWSRDQSHAPFGVKFSYFDKRRHAVYLTTKFGVRSFIRSKFTEGVQNFKFRSRDPGHAHFSGQFAMHWLVHAMFSVSAKNEVSIFGHSKDIKGVPKFRKWSRDLSHAPLGVKFSYSYKGFHGVY